MDNTPQQALNGGSQAAPPSNEPVAISPEIEPQLEESATPLVVPTQYAPPQVDFDAIYLHPSRTYHELVEAHQAAFAQQERHHTAESELLESQNREVQARSAREEAERRAVEEETRRQNELHSEAAREKAAQTAQTIATLERANGTLTRNIEWAEQNLTRSENQVHELTTQKQKLEGELSEQKKEVEALNQKWLNTIGVAVVAVLVVGFTTYQIANDESARQKSTELAAVRDELEGKNTALESTNQELRQRNNGLAARVRGLMPTPTPAVDEGQVQRIVENRYAAMDEAHNSEDARGAFQFVTGDYVFQTNEVKDSVRELRAHAQSAYFRPTVLHQAQTTLVVSETAEKFGAQGEAGTESSQENSEENSEAARPVIQVIDDNTVTVEANRTVYTWMMHNQEPDDPTKTFVETQQNTVVGRDTWVRKRPGDWRLASTVVQEVSKQVAGPPLPIQKCSRITCGDYFNRGVEEPFRNDRTVIKRCPECKGRLYFVSRY